MGWELKPEGLPRRGLRPDEADPALLASDGAIDVECSPELLGRASAIDIVTASPSSASVDDRRALAADRAAPDFELPDLDGNPIALHDYDGKKRLIATWASWCGCRYDLPAWQALQKELPDLQILSISLDNTADDAREFGEAAAADFPVLIDVNHTVAESTGSYNVPSVVWIDEAGKVARAPSSRGDDPWREFTSDRLVRASRSAT